MHEKLGMIPEGDGLMFQIFSQYNQGLDLYQFLANNPAMFIDQSGLWGTNIHCIATSNWAVRVGYPYEAANAVGAADEAVDGWQGVGPRGPVFYQSYHFNRNRHGGNDTRIQLYWEHYSNAKQECQPQTDNPTKAAKELGTSLHPLQDYVAHGDYGLRDSYISNIHNSESPQTAFGPPSNYPDDQRLDAVGSFDGRPAGNAILWISKTVTPNPGQGGIFPPPPITVWYDYAIYAYGSKRINKTERDTKSSLYYFRRWVAENGGCKCKKYFGILW
jgi:hypothetical protein